jgi:hypothetical protein
MATIHPLRDSRGRDAYRDDIEAACEIAPDAERVIQPWQDRQGRGNPTPCTNPIVRVVLAVIAAMFAAVAIVDFAARNVQ